MAPIPKRSDQLHGHRKPPKVTKGVASPRWVDENGDIWIACGEPSDIPYQEVDVIYYDVTPRPGIVVEFDPDEE